MAITAGVTALAQVLLQIHLWRVAHGRVPRAEPTPAARRLGAALLLAGAAFIVATLLIGLG